MVRMLPKPKPFSLEDWYASEPAKRKLGRICQAVNEQGREVHLLGSEDSPLLVLADAADYPPRPDEIEISIDEAKADWPAITTAVGVYGTQFRLRGKKVVRAVLFKHPDAEHPAERYRRSTSPELDQLARQIEGIAKEIRKLGHKMSLILKGPYGNLNDVANSLTRSADLIDRRFREAWRLSQGYGVN
ncbi:hypothetical protein [Azospirillum brasilense]|uniref:hypothetical protein n=1 Tax=Azospirillum brasilense TaxID=192 RepID=UPI0013B3E0E9|nr:hypothetical protein [Azospirillum brasilense]